MSHALPFRMEACRSSRSSIVRLALLVGALGFAMPARADIPPGYDAIGSFDVQNRYQRPQVAIYVPLKAGGGLHLLVEHHDPVPVSLPPHDPASAMALVRVEDPNEALLFYRIVDTGSDPTVYPALAADNLAEGLLLEKSLTVASDGVHVVRMGAGYEHTSLTVGVPKGTPYAVSYSNGIWQEWRPTVAPLWFWLPSHPTEAVQVEFRWAAGSFTISRGDGTQSQTLDAEGQIWTHSLAADASGELWKLVPTDASWKLRAGGSVPILAATTAVLAEQLQAGLLPVESGPMAGEMVPHRFQKRLLEKVVPKLLTGVGEGVELANLASAALGAQACTAITDPTVARQAISLLEFEIPATAAALDTWRFGEAATHPFVDAPESTSMIPIFAYLASRHNPCNPWGPSTPEGTDGRVELIYRAALAAIPGLLDVTEDERLRVGGDEFETYPGGAASFEVHYRARPFASLAPLLWSRLPAPLGEELLAAYTEAIRRIALDRRFTAYITSTRNQTAHLVPSMAALALVASPLPFEQAARAYAERFAASADPVGWFMEDAGPDATYSGITHNLLADYYLLSSWLPGCSDQGIRKALQRSYSFFNATVAPEPNGTLLGGFNFNHRTDWGFYLEQYNGAKGIARDIPEVALHSAPVPDASVEDLQAAIATEIGKFDYRRTVSADPAYILQIGFHFMPLQAADFYHFPVGHSDLRWPAENPTTDVLFGSELYAVRRKGYYAAFYVGNPNTPGNTGASDVVRMLQQVPPAEDCPEAHIQSWEDTGKTMPDYNAPLCAGPPDVSFHVAYPFVGGGLTTLWTPAAGTVLLGANWSPVVHHGLVALVKHPTTGQLERTWERYGATAFGAAGRDLVENSGLLPHSFDAPDGEGLSYLRRYDLGDDALEVTVTLTNETAAPISFEEVWENLPFPLCDEACETHFKGRPVGFVDAQGNELDAGDVRLDTLHVVDESGHGIAVELLDGPTTIRLRPLGLKQDRWGQYLQIGRAELPIAATALAANETATLRYRLRTLDPIAEVPPVTTVPDIPEVICGPIPEGPAEGDADTSSGSDDGGCGCRLQSAREGTWWYLIALFALALRVRRKKCS